jgi:uncharacterized protein (TIGR03790 family)
MSISARNPRKRCMARAALCAALVSVLMPAGAQSPRISAALQPSQLAVVVNDDDADSVYVAAQYRKQRAIPEANVVHVRISGQARKLDAAQFAQLKQQIDSQLGPQIQAVVMAWTAPYAVECQGITAAYTLGFDPKLCSKPCGPAPPSPLFNSPSRLPFADHHVRLSMLLPASNRELARALIARGIAADAAARATPGKPPKAGAYYVLTPDPARNSRAAFFPHSGVVKGKNLTLHTQQGTALENVRDVMLYEIGAATVERLDTVQFLPGALADHLTSFGGDLLGTAQMSSLRWLEAGATASYGTVSEPCNYWQKFPHPAVLLSHYVRGASAIEAYWKSVAWPAQGVFIGEPLAAPYR